VSGRTDMMDVTEQGVKIIECPRDAMQGLHGFVPTEVKVNYLNTLLKVGFDTLDFGSFVSPKAIPQMKDTAEVLEKLQLHDTQTKLLAIIANTRGAEQAVRFPQIAYIGYPFSISETFQLRNTNATIQESLDRLREIIELANRYNKETVVYISMGFGNPYGDRWSAEICQQWVDQLIGLGVGTIALSDTIGIATPDSIAYLFKNLIPNYPDIAFGAHLHTQPHNWKEKIEAAWKHGCRRFDTAIQGYGGCPMAKDDLTGNMPTEKVLHFFDEMHIDLPLNLPQFRHAYQMASELFPVYQ
jgi:hydroxymethylglutaryl-CoA lyase